MSKQQLHISQVNMYARCGLQYYNRYIKGEKKMPGIALHIGIGTHKAVERDLSYKMHSGVLLEEEEVMEAARDGVAESLEEQGVDTRFEDESEDTVKGAAIDTAAGLAKVHHGQIAPSITPLELEKPFVLEMENCPMDLAGRIDIVDADGIRDTKTAGKSPSADEAEKSLQLTMYGFAEKVANGSPPKSLKLDYLVKNKKPKAVTVSAEYSQERERALKYRIVQTIAGIEKGVFNPAPPDSWGCSQRWCGYWDKCPAAHGKKTYGPTGKGGTK